MGIDIRDGQQMACITCALCIDACDSVMEKIDKPRGLISYSSLRALKGEKLEKPLSLLRGTVLRPRTVVYSTMWITVGFLMLAGLAMRERLDINVVADRNPLFVTLSDGSIRNGYTIKILNMEQRPRVFNLAIKGMPEATMTLADGGLAQAGSFDIEVEADKLRAVKAYVSLPKQYVNADAIRFSFVLTSREDSASSEHGAIFHGPSQGGK